MNPSTQGWIDKLGNQTTAFPFPDKAVFYSILQKTGFVYGMHVTALTPLATLHTLTEEEIAKINLLLAFYHIYYEEKGNADFNAFTESLLHFYTKLNPPSTSLLSRIFTISNPFRQLEKRLHNRVQIDENLLTKNFSTLLTNSLLFTDVLTYRAYISNPDIHPMVYIKKIEQLVINTAYQSLNAKAVKTKYHLRLLKLFETSLRYAEKEITVSPVYEPEIIGGLHVLEKKYLLDIAAMAIWEDTVIDAQESNFIHKLAAAMHLPANAAEDAMAQLHSFYEQHKNRLSQLQRSTGIRNFYDHSYKMVSHLIIRNKKRLQRELMESKELVVLLSKSTSRELSKEEKQKVKSQLLDVFKAIPSLAIFALPGGSVLLPLFVKLIPKLLPSSFNENKID